MVHAAVGVSDLHSPTKIGLILLSHFVKLPRLAAMSTLMLSFHRRLLSLARFRLQRTSSLRFVVLLSPTVLMHIRRCPRTRRVFVSRLLWQGLLRNVLRTRKVLRWAPLSRLGVMLGWVRPNLRADEL